MTKVVKEWETINEIINEHTPVPTQEVGEKLCFYEEVDFYYVISKDNLSKIENIEELEEPEEDAENDEETKHDSKEEELNSTSITKENTTKDSGNPKLEEDKDAESENVPLVYTAKHQSNKDIVQEIDRFNNARIEELSSSTGSDKSCTSDMDYRKRKQKSFKVYQRFKCLRNRRTAPTFRRGTIDHISTKY